MKSEREIEEKIQQLKEKCSHNLEGWGGTVKENGEEIMVCSGCDYFSVSPMDRALQILALKWVLGKHPVNG